MKVDTYGVKKTCRLRVKEYERYGRVIGVYPTVRNWSDLLVFGLCCAEKEAIRQGLIPELPALNLNSEHTTELWQDKPSPGKTGVIGGKVKAHPGRRSPTKGKDKKKVAGAPARKAKKPVTNGKAKAQEVASLPEKADSVEGSNAVQ